MDQTSSESRFLSSADIILIRGHLEDDARGALRLFRLICCYFTIPIFGVRLPEVQLETLEGKNASLLASNLINPSVDSLFKCSLSTNF